jgi:hypothetical protein
MLPSCARGAGRSGRAITSAAGEFRFTALAAASYRVSVRVKGKEWSAAEALANVVTKSGTNQIHGRAFEFVRNAAFDARNFFDHIDMKGDLKCWGEMRFAGRDCISLTLR